MNSLSQHNQTISNCIGAQGEGVGAPTIIMTAFSFQPVIIIGAARSGTNMLRDLITQLPGTATWPCDEINYVWRYGNAQAVNDELKPAQVKPRTKQYIRQKFIQLARNTGANWIVEKTCANSLRVDFVRAIVPEAKFIFLVRNGLDVAASASRQWHGNLEPYYILKKAVYVPWKDLPYYAARYFKHRVWRSLNRKRQLPTWGPRFAALDAMVKSGSCIETCLWQWKASVDAASSALAKMPDSQVCRVYYEQFVRSPVDEFQTLCDFLEIPCSHSCAVEVTRGVSESSVGAYAKAAELQVLTDFKDLVDATLVQIDRQWNTRANSEMRVGA